MARETHTNQIIFISAVVILLLGSAVYLSSIENDYGFSDGENIAGEAYKSKYKRLQKSTYNPKYIFVSKAFLTARHRYGLLKHVKNETKEEPQTSTDDENESVRSGVDPEGLEKDNRTDESVCFDSDSGINLNFQGTATVGDISRQDSCDDINHVREYYCEENRIRVADIETQGRCPEGLNCYLGHCRNTCSDSDGQDLFQKGTIIGLDQETNVIVSQEDRCAGEFSVREYYCPGNGYIGHRDFDCPDGMYCHPFEGRCVSS